MRHGVIPASSTAGVALSVIFSGGTFLYAACVHLLPEATNTANFTADKQALLVLAALVPPILCAGHHH